MMSVDLIVSGTLQQCEISATSVEMLALGQIIDVDFETLDSFTVSEQDFVIRDVVWRNYRGGTAPTYLFDCPVGADHGSIENFEIQESDPGVTADVRLAGTHIAVGSIRVRGAQNHGVVISGEAITIDILDVAASIDTGATSDALRFEGATHCTVGKLINHQDFSPSRQAKRAVYFDATAESCVVDQVTTTTGASGSTGIAEDANPAGNNRAGEEHIFFINIAGTLTVATGVAQWPLPFEGEIASVWPRVATAPTGASLDLDINVNGTSVYTTKPTIAAGSNDNGEQQTALGAGRFTRGQYVTLDVDQIGSTVAGADLVCAVKLRRNG